MKILFDSNEALNELFVISQKDVMNSVTNEKSRKQALLTMQQEDPASIRLFLANSWQNWDTHNNIKSAQVCAKARQQRCAANQSQVSRVATIQGVEDSWGLHSFINTQACYQTSSSSHPWYFSLHIVPLAMFDEHVSEDTKVAMVKKPYSLKPLSIRQLITSWQIGIGGIFRKEHCITVCSSWCYANGHCSLAIVRYTCTFQSKRLN